MKTLRCNMDPFRDWVMAREYRTKPTAQNIAGDVQDILSCLPSPAHLDQKVLVERALRVAFDHSKRKRIGTLATSWRIFQRWAEEEFSLHLPSVYVK